jgi:hypothetical protein
MIERIAYEASFGGLATFETAIYSHRQMSMPRSVCPSMATATALGPPGPRRRRSSTTGLLELDV